MNGHNLRGITHPQNSWNKITIPWAGWGGAVKTKHPQLLEHTVS